MSLDKAIEHGKEKRKQYRHSAAFDPSCRPGGSCGYCLGNRLIRTKREHIRVDAEIDMIGLPVKKKYKSKEYRF